MPSHIRSQMLYPIELRVRVKSESEKEQGTGPKRKREVCRTEPDEGAPEGVMHRILRPHDATHDPFRHPRRCGFGAAPNSSSRQLHRASRRLKRRPRDRFVRDLRGAVTKRNSFNRSDLNQQTS